MLALDVVRDVQAAPDLDAYRQAVLRVQELIDCNAIGYNEVDRETGETFLVFAPEERLSPGIPDAFSRWSHQHPVVRHHRETGDPRARAISDFLSEAELHELELYRDVYAPLGAEDQLSFILPSPPGLIVGIAMNRETRGFSDSERELIELVRPHLSQSFRDVHMRERADPLSAARLASFGLSEREAEVTRLLIDGRSAGEIGEELVISVHTARNHIAHVYEKLGVRNRAAAVAAVLRAERLS
jgi:DNA-binding CsgD family transcriptional regulator